MWVGERGFSLYTYIYIYAYMWVGDRGFLLLVVLPAVAPAAGACTHIQTNNHMRLSTPTPAHPTKHMHTHTNQITNQSLLTDDGGDGAGAKDLGQVRLQRLVGLLVGWFWWLVLVVF